MYKKTLGVTKCRNKSYYHLYRHYIQHFVFENVPLDEDVPLTVEFPPLHPNSMALLCKSCFDDAKESKNPSNSLVMGIQFGITRFLPKLSFMGKLAIHTHHLYAHIFKIKNVHGQLGLYGNSIVFEDMSRKLIETWIENRQNTDKILLPQRLNQHYFFSLMYTGKLDKWKKLIARNPAKPEGDLMKSFGKYLYIDCSDICQHVEYWLFMKPDVFTKNITLSNQDQIDEMIEKDLINQTIIKDETTLTARIDAEIDDAPPPLAGADGTTEDIIDNGTIEISYVDVGKDDAEAEAINDRMNVFRALQKELNIIPDVTIRHAGDPMNEYRDFPAICDGVFPYLFLHGYPYPKTPSKEQIMHMFNQASNDFSDDPIFIIFMFNFTMRRKVSQAVHYSFLKNPEVTKELTKLINEDNFAQDIERAVNNPNDEFAILFEKWLKRLMVKLSSNLNFAVGTGSNAVAQMLASRRYYSNGGFFLTLAPLSPNYGYFYLYAFGLLNNNDIHRKSLQEDLNTNECYNTYSKRKMLKNFAPYADVKTYLTVTKAIFNTLIKEPYDHKTKSNRTLIKPYHQSKEHLRGILGDILSYYSCNEITKQGNLHSHTKLWHAIDYRYIHQIAHDPELNKKLGIYFNSIISSELSDRVFGLPLHERPTMGPATEVLFNNNMPSTPKIPYYLLVQIYHLMRLIPFDYCLIPWKS